MFRCESCNQVHLKPIKVTTETRPKAYPFRKEVFHNGVNIRDDGSIKTGCARDDPGGSGYETVKEVTVCSNCRFDYPYDWSQAKQGPPLLKTG